MKISIKTIGLFLGPLIFLGVHYGLENALPTQGASIVLGLAGWMVCWWVTEAAPMAVTALLPIVIFPIAGVYSIQQATAPYSSHVIFLFLGGFLLALGLEEHGLHKRIALNLIRVTGTSANGIILGFMLATWFLSMWISNTATTIMMLPIAASVIDLLNKGKVESNQFSMFALSLMISIAYSANIGGFATIIGTPPNVVFVGYVQQMLKIDIGFAQWLLIGIPISGILVFIAYKMLTKVLFPHNIGKIEGADDIINFQLQALGSMKREEKLVALIFGLTAFLWIFKKVINDIIGVPVLHDTVSAMIGGVLMFVFPVNIKEGKSLLSWSAATRLPWGILLLFGGGMCLAKGMETTGLVDIIGDAVSESSLSTIFVLAILVAVMLFMTELMSNIALTTIFIPVVFGIGQGMGMNPLLLSIPVAIAASCAFMMPIATPPNAIVFASGHIRMKDMIKAGIWLNIISVLLLVLAAVTIIPLVFGN